MNWPAWRLYGLIILVTMVGGELLARVYDWSPRSRDLAAGDNLGMGRYHHSPAGLGDLVPHQDGHWVIWFHRPYHVQTNSVGLRNNEEPFDKAFRILALGDSQTFGPYLANEDTWPAWTENYLRQRPSAARTQVFNAGIAGYTIVDELSYLREKGLRLKPHIVVLAVYENDLADLRKEREGLVQRPAGDRLDSISTSLKVLARNSALVSLAEQVKTRVQFARANIDLRRGEAGPASALSPKPTDQEQLATRYDVLFREMVELLKSQGISLSVIFIPAADLLEENASSSAMEPVIRGAAAVTGTHYLDLTPTFRAQPDAVARLYLLQRNSAEGWTGNAHLSREGNAVIGRTLADWLVQKRLAE